MTVYVEEEHIVPIPSAFVSAFVWHLIVCKLSNELVDGLELNFNWGMVKTK